jgi:hypothetical protein
VAGKGAGRWREAGGGLDLTCVGGSKTAKAALARDFKDPNEEEKERKEKEGAEKKVKLVMKVSDRSRPEGGQTEARGAGGRPEGSWRGRKEAGGKLEGGRREAGGRPEGNQRAERGRKEGRRKEGGRSERNDQGLIFFQGRCAVDPTCGQKVVDKYHVVDKGKTEIYNVVLNMTDISTGGSLLAPSPLPPLPSPSLPSFPPSLSLHSPPPSPPLLFPRSPH